MIESFYVNASGPAKFSVFGRVYKPEGGESCGPFPISALEQINVSRDRHLLHIVKVEVPVETLPEAPKEEYFQPIANSVDAAVKEDIFVANAAESVELCPDAVAPIEQPTESTVSEVLPEPIEPEFASNLEPVIGATTTEVDGAEDDENAPKARARRSRKQKPVE